MSSLYGPQVAMTLQILRNLPPNPRIERLIARFEAVSENRCAQAGNCQTCPVACFDPIIATADQKTAPKEKTRTESSLADY